MGLVFRSNERDFAPEICDFWQINRIPRSPLSRDVRFMRWLHTDSEENYHKRGNKDFSVEGVGYEFNNFGYRGPELRPASGQPSVIFLGDSNTMGIGMPWEALWTSLVANHLEASWGTPVHQFNLAWSGSGSDYVAMMVHQCAEVLKPAAVFVLWSYVTRMMWFADTRHQVHFVPEHTPGTNSKEHDAYLRLVTDPHSFFNYVRNFHFVNDRLLRLGIPYYWANLEYFSDAMLRPYVPLERFVGRWKRVDFARDARHGGPKTHAALASAMIAAVEDDRLTPDGAARC